MASISFQITMVRHGQTVNNMLQLLQGQKLDAPLNVKGRNQAHQVGRVLKDESFSHIYCSDLKRAIETCEIILQENDSHKGSFENKANPPYSIDPRLRERCMGIMEGQPLAILRKKANEYNQHRRVFTPEGGETLRDLAKRTDSFLRNLCNRLWNNRFSLRDNSQSPANVLIVAHSGSIRSLVGVMGQKYDCDVPDNLIDLPCENTSVTQASISLKASADFPVTRRHTVEDNNQPYTVVVECTNLFNSKHLKSAKKEKLISNVAMTADGI